jgi:hypothetical protein
MTLVNRTSTRQTGTVEISSLADGDTAEPVFFDVSGRSEDYERELVQNETYEFSVTLDSGASGEFELPVNRQTALQIDLSPGDVRFRRLEVPAP